MPPQGPSSHHEGREQALHQYVFSQNLERLKGNPAAVMDVMHEWISSQGHMMTFKPSKIEVALEVLAKTRPKTVVELGTYVGFSALAWVISMELDEEFANISSDLVKLAGLDDVVEIMQGPSGESLTKLSEHGIDKIDYLFIDHWEKHYLPDLQQCEQLDLLHQGSVIIADNTDMPGAPDYVEYVKAGGRGRYEYSSCTYATTGDQGQPNVLEVSSVA